MPRGVGRRERNIRPQKLIDVLRIADRWTRKFQPVVVASGTATSGAANASEIVSIAIDLRHEMRKMTARDRVDASLATPNMVARVSSVFGLLALVLAAVGLSGWWRT